MTTASLECVTPSETGVDFEENGGGKGRRFAVLASASAFIAGLATLVNATPAAADCLGSPCCSLATCTWCNYAVNRDRFTCSSGWTRRTWSCTTAGGSIFWCGECAKGASCWNGPWNCSIWFAN